MRQITLIGSLVAMALGVAGGTGAEETIVLAQNGQARATIVLARTPTRAAQFAAYELQWHLKQVTGGEFPIVGEDQPVSGPVVLVGDSQRVRALGIPVPALASQEYLIRFLPEVLVLVGHDQDDPGTVQYSQTPTEQALATWPGIWDEQGTMYAVYDFLERHCDIRWFNPTESGIDCPRRATLTVTGGELRRAPFMQYRYASYGPADDYDRYTGLWPAGSEGQKKWEAAAYAELHRQFDSGGYSAAKRGWNMLFRLRHREGGERCFGNHSLYGYYRRFWEEEQGQESLFVGRRAEMFAQGYQGQPPQMCYTSQALVEQVVQDACEFFASGKTYPGAQAGGNCFCVEPMDNDQFCKCAACQQWLDGRDADSPFFTNGRHSDYFFQFVNEVAKRVRPRFPDKRIVCLAYMTHGAPPQKLRLEPNIIVQYCFACNRLNFDRPSYEHEVELLRQWREAYPDRTLYLWLYDTFPVEIALNGNFHCFPGFFAHTVGEQFALFRQHDYRGVFHCGYGQDVEAYLTYRLMDDPGLNVDALLEEYFTRLYGPAAGPLRKFYELVEQTYGDPANYPEPIAAGRREGHHHQTEEVAWGYLGNASRMSALGKLIDEARAAAETPLQRQRVALFAGGTWDYMVAGRTRYLEQIQSRHSEQRATLRVPFPATGPVPGAPARLDASEALALTKWSSPLGEPTRRKVQACLLNDGVHLYVQCEEHCDRAAVRSTDDIAGGDYWQVLLAAEPAGQIHNLMVSPAGKQQLDDRPGTLAVTTDLQPDRWITTITLPLAQFGISPGGACYLNVIRRSGTSPDQPMWAPSFGDFTDPRGLRHLVLDDAATIPSALPTPAELERLDAQDLVARWSCAEGRGTVVQAVAGDLSGRLPGDMLWERDGSRSVLRLQDNKRQFVDFGSLPALNLTGPLTLMLWVKYEPTDMWYPALLGKGYEQTGTYGMHVRPGGTVWFEIDAPDGTRHHYNPTERCLTPGRWCHVAATYDGATMRVYVNGRSVGDGQPVTTTIRTNDEPLRFGWLGSFGFFNGCVRDISVYRRALSAGEVFAQYRQSR